MLDRGRILFKFHILWRWSYWNWELITTRDPNQGNSIRTTSRREKWVCGRGLDGVQSLFRGRWLDIISKVYFML